jgi:Ca-activated chloride channel family protein
MVNPMGDEETYYEILETSRDATTEEIRFAYFEAARKYHPDTNPSPLAKDHFLRIQSAYEVLNDPNKREKYNSSLKNQSDKQDSIKATITFSRPSLQIIEDPQLIYARLELEPTLLISSPAPTRTHLCLILDRSTSMKGSRIEMVKENIIQLIQNLKSSDLISIVAFSDKAEVVFVPTRADEAKLVEAKIRQITCFGATEIHQGIKAGVDLLWGNSTPGLQKVAILLTDGHTYGDEDACIKLAQKLQQKGISLNALGIGHEWNAPFLEQLSAITGGSTQYIQTHQDLKNYFKKLSEEIKVVALNCLVLEIDLNEDVDLQYFYRINPEVAELTIKSPMSMGDLYAQHKSVFLFSLLVPPIKMSRSHYNIGRGKVRYTNNGKPERIVFPLTLPVGGSDEILNPSREIVEALSKINLYQLQEKANQDVSAGKYDQAANRLGYLSTQLLKQGNPKLAALAASEADSLKTKRKYSDVGDKQLKYGTKALISPPNESSLK